MTDQLIKEAQSASDEVSRHTVHTVPQDTRPLSGLGYARTFSFARAHTHTHTHTRTHSLTHSKGKSAYSYERKTRETTRRANLPSKKTKSRDDARMLLCNDGDNTARPASRLKADDPGGRGTGTYDTSATNSDLLREPARQPPSNSPTDSEQLANSV